MTRPFVSVSLEGPDDGGDFGRNTLGTATGGIQEAIDYAHANLRDVYIWGGRGGVHDGIGTSGNVYGLDETLRIPWSQDFRLDGGNYVLAYRPKTGHAVHFDSQMNCRYKFGLITSASEDSAVAIRPESEGPDDFVVVTVSVFDFSCIVCNHPEATGLLLDSSKGQVINSTVFAEETNTRGTGVHVSDGNGAGFNLSNNRMTIPYGNQYHGTGNCTGLQLGDANSTKVLHNTFDLSFHAPRAAHFDKTTRRYVAEDGFVGENAVGARIHAQRNYLTLSMFGTRDNTIVAMSLPNGVTNNARVPSNRIISNWPTGFSIDTPPVPPSGETLVNRTSHAVQLIIVEPGEVSAWTITDCGSTAPRIPYNLSLVDNSASEPPPPDEEREPVSQTIENGPVAGQTMLLEPGDGVAFNYTEPPVWRWKGYH